MFKYPLAVTIDTNIFDAAKYDLSDGSTIRLLENYVKDGTLKVVLSNIVVRESKKHLSKQVQKICSISRKLRTEILKESTEHLVKHIGLDELLNIPRDKKSLEKKSEELFEIFLHEINAEILNNDLIDLDKIIDDYFEINPPFEDGEKKRKEFPDAFIANQIIKRFGDNEVVAIVSNDKGFKKACQQTKNHLFFDSLGELYDAINKEKAEYEETKNIIKELQFSISSSMLDYIKTTGNFVVNGLSVDRDGIVSGFDYNEFYLNNIEDMSFIIHSVDKLEEESAIVTLNCKVKISVDCYYDDYDNAAWDSERKEYVFVDTVEVREEHVARFACRIEVNRKEKTFNVFPFKIILGGDSRKNRYHVEHNNDYDYEGEIKAMERDALGFVSLGSYKSFLEESLPSSEMHKNIITQFEKIDALHQTFEDFCINYDSLLAELADDYSAKKVIKNISKALEAISDFPGIIDEDNIDEYEIEEIKNWVETKYNKSSEIAEETNLPDTLDYGATIVIKGIDNSELTLVIDEIVISPTEGSEEYIGINLFDNKERIANGYVKLTVGYLHFDEDGGADQGLDDNIEYNYNEIAEIINEFILEQQQKVEEERKIVEIIENILNAD